MAVTNFGSSRMRHQLATGPGKDVPGLRYADGQLDGPVAVKPFGGTMVLAPGDREGGPDNRHRGSDQWLYVLWGTGLAMLGRKRQSLRAGTLLLIERGTTHEIRNTGRSRLTTVNLYVPPAYSSKGDPLPRGRP